MDNHKNKIEHWQIIAVFLAIYDFVSLPVAFFAVLLLRHDLRYHSIDYDMEDSQLMAAEPDGEPQA